MEGWKISEIIHMFTQPLKHPGGGPHKDKPEKGSTAKDMTSTSGGFDLVKWGRGILYP